MNKGQFVKALSAELGVSQKMADDALNAVLDLVQKTLKKGDSVVFTGFGSFVVRKREAREGRNQQTGASLKIPARKVPAFKAGRTLKDAVR